MTTIEWTQRVWNPTTGCDRVSPGCDNCYALTMARRLKGMGSAKYQNDGDPRTSGPGFGIAEHADVVTEPFTWRKPQKVFVNSMSDLFHSGISDDFIARVFAVMAATPQHTYQVLTKRHGRMRSLLSSPQFIEAVMRELHESLDLRPDYLDTLAPPPDYPADVGHRPWPLSNVWLGVSVEDQKRADLRIPALLGTPASVRFLSCEPLLGPVDLFGVRNGLDWVIVGGESGPGARPMHPDWARQLRDQCQAAGVAFHFKQRGAWTWNKPTGWPAQDWAVHPDRNAYITAGGRCEPLGQTSFEPGGAVVYRVGKKAAGRELDGRTWDEYPTAVTP